MATTAAQTAANQANAQHSTGPRTPEGKQASARNATKHGFRSQAVLLPGDDPAEYQALLDTLTEHFDAPQSDLTAQRCVREMADAEWRLRRVRQYLEITIARKIEELKENHPDADAIELQALAWTEDRANLASLMKYEQKYERQYDRAYRLWLRYQEVKRTAEWQAAQEMVRQNDEQFKKHHEALRDEIRNRTNEPNPPGTPRNAPCPCGSGQKHKRCCGKDAPPVLGRQAA